MKKMLYLYKYAKRYWIFAVLTPIFMVAEALLELQIPSYISELLTIISEGNGTTEKLLEIAFQLLFFSLLSLIAGILGGIFASIAASGYSMELKNELFKKVESFSFSNIDKYTTSSLITRMTTDVNWVTMSFQMSIRMLFRSPALFIYAIIKASKVSSGLTLVYFIAIPIIIGALITIFACSHPLFEKGIKQIDKLNEKVEENIRGIRVVKSFTLEKQEINKFEETNDKIYKTFSKAHKIVNVNGPVMTFSMYVVIIIITYLCTISIAKGEMKFGVLNEMITYSVQILTSLMFISFIFAMFIISKPSRTRIFEVLNEVPTIKNIDNPIKDVKDGSVEFKNCYFKYNESSEKYVLNNINLKINSGETIGILGTTGSSKTTLISLIARLYDATKGEVKVGGINVKEYDLEALRDAVSVVLQKNLLFSGTIKENLRWGNNKATDEELIEASKIAQCDSFIELMPDKYDTLIEQGGSNVSGGQKQRLCIARAILKDPKILILDDSMSAVDTKTDKLIRDGLKKYRPNITKIIVAQRCQSVFDADKIIIIDNGEIIDFGTHEELLNSSSIYKEIYYSQNKEEKANE